MKIWNRIHRIRYLNFDRLGTISMPILDQIDPWQIVLFSSKSRSRGERLEYFDQNRVLARNVLKILTKIALPSGASQNIDEKLRSQDYPENLHDMNILIDIYISIYIFIDRYEYIKYL